MTARPGRGILGRRGLVIGVFMLVAVALLGGRRLLHTPTNAPAGVAQALAPFPGFSNVTASRRAIGATAGAATGANAILAQGTADWRRQFAAASRGWADPPPVRAVPPVTGPDRRARNILEAGIHLGDWAQHLMGIPGLLEIARRQGTIAGAAVAADTAHLDGCLAGAWGRSLVPPGELVAVAESGQRAWIARGAATGLPSTCGAAIGG